MYLRFTPTDHSHLQGILQTIGMGNPTLRQVRDLTPSAKPLTDGSPQSKLLEILYVLSNHFPRDELTTDPKDFAHNAFVWMIQNPTVDMSGIYSSLSGNDINSKVMRKIDGILHEFYSLKLDRKDEKAIPEFVSECNVPEDCISFVAVKYPRKSAEQYHEAKATPAETKSPFIPNVTLNDQQVDRTKVYGAGVSSVAAYLRTRNFSEIPLEEKLESDLPSKYGKRHFGVENSHSRKVLLKQKMLELIKRREEQQREMENQTANSQNNDYKTGTIRVSHKTYVPGNVPASMALKHTEASPGYAGTRVYETRYADASRGAPGSEQFLPRAKMIVPSK